MRTGRASSREISITLRLRQTDTAQNSTEQNNLRHQDRRKLTGEQRTGDHGECQAGHEPMSANSALSLQITRTADKLDPIERGVAGKVFSHSH